MKVHVAPAHCISSGQCVMTAPNVFDQDDDGLVTLITDSPEDADRELVHEAEAGCPAAAIRVEA